MDAYDIFRKLTKGARFSKKKNAEKVKQNVWPLPENTEYKGNILSKEIKQEIDTSPENLVIKQEIDPLPDGFVIKEEIKEEDETPFQILSGFGPAEVKKKRKNKDLSPKAKRIKVEEEEVNQLRNANKINIIGKNVPPPIRTFEELELLHNVPSRLLDNLAKCGYPLPTPIQMQAIPIMLEGKPLMACAPTGSGKTVAFLTPIIRDLKVPQKKGFRAIILCPTRELAKQTMRECLRLTEGTGLKTHIISKINQIEQKFGPNSSKKYDILVSTPNRIRYLLTQEPPILDLSNIEWVVIDEADKLMEDDGQNSFKEQLDDILRACTKSERKLALFSATYTVPVAKWALKNLRKLIRVTIGEQNSATDLVKQELMFVGNESGKLLAFRDLVRSGLQPPVLVFVQSKERAKQLFDELIYDGINVDVIHADRTQLQRDNIVRAFREGKIWVLICTELMGRGIDFKGVNLVVNYDFPPSKIAYIHRIGRTGRAGRPGRAITYFTQDDTVNLRNIAQIIKNSGGHVPDFMLALKKTKKSEQKMLAKKAPNREDITTIPKFVLEKRKKLKEEREKAKQTEGAAEGSDESKPIKKTRRPFPLVKKGIKKKRFVGQNKSD